MAGDATDEVVVRVARPDDAAECGRICYAAFETVNEAHGFPVDFPVPEIAVELLGMMFSHPGYYCVVAEMGGRLVGSNCLDERSGISGVGPITIDPQVQNRGVGRKLMTAVLDRAASRGAAGVRLVQAAFHCRSLSLYADLRFDVREPLACMQGQTAQRSVAGCEVRMATAADVVACNALAQRVHGFDRGVDLQHAVERGAAKVVEREGRVTGYASELAFFGHATTESNADMQALLASAESFGGPGILVPSRNSELFRWCLANGLRVTQPMTLMSRGMYREPAGVWLPSVVF